MQLEDDNDLKIYQLKDSKSALTSATLTAEVQHQGDQNMFSYEILVHKYVHYSWHTQPVAVCQSIHIQVIQYQYFQNERLLKAS